MRRLLLIPLIALALTGCASSKQKLEARLAEARAETRTALVATQQTRTKLKEARAFLKVATQQVSEKKDPRPTIQKADKTLQEAQKETKTTAGAVENIQDAIEAATRTTPNLKDKTDPWEWFLNQLPWMIPVALLFVVGVYFGVGKLVRPVFGTLGSAIEQSLGEIDAKVEAGSMTPREGTAAKRAALGTSYEKSYKKQKKISKKEVSDV